MTNLQNTFSSKIRLARARAAADEAVEGEEGGGGVRGEVVCGNRQNPNTQDITQRIKYIIGTYSSVPMVSVMVLELHHPTMNTL